MKGTKEQKSIPSMRKGKLNIYKPSDIRRWGIEQFLSEVVPKNPIQPNFHFTPEEQQRMDALLAEDNDR